MDPCMYVHSYTIQRVLYDVKSSVVKFLNIHKVFQKGQGYQYVQFLKTVQSIIVLLTGVRGKRS